MLGSVALIAWAVTAGQPGNPGSPILDRASVWKFSIALVVIDPVYVTIYLGQINLVILALVLADFLHRGCC